MEIKRILAALILSMPFFGLSQTDTSKVEEDTILYEYVDFTEYYHVTKFFINAYPEKGTLEDDVLDTIASHIRSGSLFTTNKEVNLNVSNLARERRKQALREIGSPDTIGMPISDYINDEKSIESLWDFGYTMYDSLRKNFVMRIFDQVENCECSKSIFEQITEVKLLTMTIEDPKLKWMTFSYFQHTTEQGFNEEYIYVRWKRKRDLFTRGYMLMLGDF